MTWMLLLMLAEDVQSHAARVRASMETSIARQRIAVHRQTSAALPVETPPAPPAARACDPIAPPELAAMIETAAREQSIDVALLREVARQESGFRPCSVSRAGAEGLMQLMPATQITLDVRNPFHPQESITAGAK